MNKQNILIGAMTVAIAALGIITYQQQHYIEQLATAQQSSSISKQIKKLNRRMDDLESQIDTAQPDDNAALRSDLDKLEDPHRADDNTPSPLVSQDE